MRIEMEVTRRIDDIEATCRVAIEDNSNWSESGGDKFGYLKAAVQTALDELMKRYTGE